MFHVSVGSLVVSFKHLPVTGHGSMIISLSLNITMNQVGGASVIAKFHS